MNPIIEGYFQVVAEDMAAVRQLLAPVPRAASFHLQQAAEKLVKAIVTAEGIHVTSDHNIGHIVGMLPDGHEWKPDLMELDFLSRYATTFRYSSPTGRLANPPDRHILEHYMTLIDTLTGDAREWCRDRG
jgi:HEPN domain-containing protein